MAPSPTLRIAHTGCSGLRLELGSGATFAVDPATDPGPVDAIIVTWNERERLQGAVEAVRSGRRPRVVARPAILAWLARHGAVDAVEPDTAVAGVGIEAETYQPVPYATPTEALRKIRSGVLGPVRAGRRLATRARLPSAEPVVLRLTLPDSSRLLHLNCALHRGTPDAWLSRMARDWGGASWLLVSWDYEEDAAFEERIPAFDTRCLVLTDLVNEVRTAIGLPRVTRTLTADRLSDAGLPVQLLAARTSLRFGSAPTA